MKNIVKVKIDALSQTLNSLNSVWKLLNNHLVKELNHMGFVRSSDTDNWNPSSHTIVLKKSPLLLQIKLNKIPWLRTNRPITNGFTVTVKITRRSKDGERLVLVKNFKVDFPSFENVLTKLIRFIGDVLSYIEQIKDKYHA